MTPNDQIKAYLHSMTDGQIKNLIKDFNQLGDTGALPPNSEYRSLTETICKIYGIDFNLKMGESWLQYEVFKRYSKLPF